MQLTITEEQRQEIEQGLILQKKALQKNKKNNEDIGNFTGMQEADRRLHILEGGPGGETGLLEMIYRESKDQGPLFERADEEPDESQTATTQSVDEALDDPNFERQPTPFDDDVVEEEAEAPVAEAEELEDEPEEKGGAVSTDPQQQQEDEPADATGTPLLTLDVITPTHVSIFGEHGIKTVEQLEERFDEIGDFKGIGPATIEMFQEALDARMEPAEASEEDEDEEEATGPQVGDVVVPAKNPSFTLEVADRIDDTVILHGAGVAEGDEKPRYSLLEDLEWDDEHERWTTSKLHLLEDEPAEMPA